MRRAKSPTPALKRRAGHYAGTASRVSRLLLALTEAGERGLLVNEIVELNYNSRQTLYKDLRRIEADGWALVTTYEQTLTAPLEARYKLAPWQHLPRVRKPKPVRSAAGRGKP